MHEILFGRNCNAFINFWKKIEKDVLCPYKFALLCDNLKERNLMKIDMSRLWNFQKGFVIVKPKCKTKEPN